MEDVADGAIDCLGAHDVDIPGELNADPHPRHPRVSQTECHRHRIEEHGRRFIEAEAASRAQAGRSGLQR